MALSAIASFPIPKPSPFSNVNVKTMNNQRIFASFPIPKPFSYSYPASPFSNVKTISSISALVKNTRQQILASPASIPKPFPCEILAFSNLRASHVTSYDDVVEKLKNEKKLVFGDYEIRNAVLNEEFWMAAYLQRENSLEIDPKSGRSHSLKRIEGFPEEDRVRGEQMYQDHHQGQSWCVIADPRNKAYHIGKRVVGTLSYTRDVKLFAGEGINPGAQLDHSYIDASSVLDIEEYFYISSVNVVKHARKQKLGTKLAQFVIDYAGKKGKKNIYTRVERANLPALKMFKALGFKETDGKEEEEEPLLLLRFRA
ncbi:hypothetical protein V6N11_059730 [Hibiscus sabdariffa]|uniref:N-acetyltransferase domain-containing protein n=1 Tax=Hibiscus sabdariffa TaxID=183260 RepID=A0ABR2NXY1_9ROSI